MNLTAKLALLRQGQESRCDARFKPAFRQKSGKAQRKNSRAIEPKVVGWKYLCVVLPQGKARLHIVVLVFHSHSMWTTDGPIYSALLLGFIQPEGTFAIPEKLFLFARE